MFSRFLMICTGNICRSPMAEAVMARRLAERGLPGTVESAGIGALVGRPADPLAVDLMSERGLDISGHRARQLTRELLAAFELALVMEEGQRRAVEQLFPEARGRVHRLGRFGAFDVPDPYGRPRADFERSLALIDRGVAELEKALWR